jgi:hypothetical protein
MSNTQNAIITIDGFADGDPTASPLRGTSVRFKDGAYFAFTDRLKVEGKTYAAFDKTEGWQKLQKDCPPEYLMRTPGEPRPPQPHVDQKDWSLDLNGKPQHPWKLTYYLYLLDCETGEVATFWSNTTGGRIALGQLTDQVKFMRRVRPGAIPVVALESKDMPTQFGSTKPRPHFKICGWKTSDSTEQRLLTGETPLVEVEAPPLAEQLDDELPDYLSAEAPKKKKK